MSDSAQNIPKASRRQSILDAALTCFASKGFAETTMEDIRKLSGTSTGSIYHHFSNKELLAQALYLEGRTSSHAALATSFVERIAQEGVQALVYAYLGWFEQHPDLGQYLMQAGESEYLNAYIKVLRQKTKTTLPAETLSERVLQWLTPSIESRNVRRLPESLYVPLILGSSREFVRIWLRTRHAEVTQEAYDPLAQAAWLVVASAQA
ncbi:TetR/AcrR family transcriptional regulator [Ktedonospora formicarum]|uniref:TetR family transcriptional regulator n=1 Tax=Ktedonospora formicarum TaxID=2778364 RepID=A0A8J3I924_9CHLR|nr:TetR/AcrR family transcriptional regulator [Ktedonospora formicarum]GHO46914.1 TetR family transcriptional regulator [Ktedonospora formicarum]